jgi:hypothetical protein
MSRIVIAISIEYDDDNTSSIVGYKVATDSELSWTKVPSNELYIYSVATSCVVCQLKFRTLKYNGAAYI